MLGVKKIERYGLSMSKEAVLKVMGAEDEAERIIADATIKAKSIVEDAKKQADEECIALRESLKTEYSERVANVRQDSKVLIDESIEKAQREAQSLERRAKLNMPAAVRYICRRFADECQ